MSLTDLPVAEYDTRASGFVPQQKEDMCYTACLTNVLNDLGRRRGIPLKFSLGEMNRLCDYREGLQCNERGIPGIMDDRLRPMGYAWMVKSGPGLDLDFLRTICNDPACSLPIVSVAADYFEKKGLRISGRYHLDHALILMGIDHEVVYLFDPFEKLFRRGGYRGDLPRDMPIPSFLGVWDSAHEPRWVAWARPLPTKQVRLQLEPEDG